MVIKWHCGFYHHVELIQLNWVLVWKSKVDLSKPIAIRYRLMMMILWSRFVTWILCIYVLAQWWSHNGKYQTVKWYNKNNSFSFIWERRKRIESFQPKKKNVANDWQNESRSTINNVHQKEESTKMSKHVRDAHMHSEAIKLNW